MSQPNNNQPGKNVDTSSYVPKTLPTKNSPIPDMNSFNITLIGITTIVCIFLGVVLSEYFSYKKVEVLAQNKFNSSTIAEIVK